MNLLSALLRLRPRRSPRRRGASAAHDYADMGTAFGLDAMLEARGPQPPLAPSDGSASAAARGAAEPTAPGALSSGA